MKYAVAERFKAPQGEGLFAGTPMAFVRFVGCSVGQHVCTACDTDFDRMLPELGGGTYTPEELVDWARPYEHLCLTGGEPMDRDLLPMMRATNRFEMQVHVETSGTVLPRPGFWDHHAKVWTTVSPKPGYHGYMIRQADEIKVILGGLGDGPGWPTIEDALRWAGERKLVYVQPRNDRMDIRQDALRQAVDIVSQHPQLRLSVQLHKFLRTR